MRGASVAFYLTATAALEVRCGINLHTDGEGKDLPTTKHKYTRATFGVVLALRLIMLGGRALDVGLRT